MSRHHDDKPAENATSDAEIVREPQTDVHEDEAGRHPADSRQNSRRAPASSDAGSQSGRTAGTRAVRAQLAVELLKNLAFVIG
jgi:hypothetical protein